jgi:glycosyltransferase involved in cell wall biosynthesis
VSGVQARGLPDRLSREAAPAIGAAPHPLPVTSLSVFFPCFNDAPTIGGLVLRIDALLDALGIAHEIIVVNDGSTDGSDAVLRELTEELPDLRIVAHETNRGYGAALRSGFAAATREWVFYTDGDAQFDPAEVVHLIAHASDGVDVVQGWKIGRSDSRLRALIGRAYHHVVRFSFRLPVRDTDCDFRLIRTSLLRRVTLRHSSGVICVEMLRKFWRAGARFAEVPVHHYPRPFGRSEFFRPRRVAESLRDVVWLWVQLIVLRRDDA